MKLSVSLLNLEKAVGCARVCRARRVQQGQRTKRATAKEAKASEAENLSVHAVCEMFTSGQLLFLDSNERCVVLLIVY
jgi:hypothetical protein